MNILVRTVTGVIAIVFLMLSGCGGNATRKEFEEAYGTMMSETSTEVALTPTPHSIGNARVTFTLGEDTFTLEDGECTAAHDESWFAVSAGEEHKDRFTIRVGPAPMGMEDVRPAKGGGTFSREKFLSSIWLRGQMVAFGSEMGQEEEDEVVLAPDLKSGTFRGTAKLMDSGEWMPIDGEFECR